MKTLLFILFTFITINSQAQVSGFITDENNQPVPGATVRSYRDTTLLRSVITNNKGHFKLDEAGDHLMVSFIGYETLWLDNKGNWGQVRLKPDKRMLNQVSIVSQQPIINK